LDDGLYRCVVEGCEYSCIMTSLMFHHLSTHFHPLNLICQDCSATFQNYLKFRHHLRQHKYRKNPKPTIQCICDHCGTKASSKTNLLRHIKSKHLNVRYFCDECTAQFTAAEVLFCHKVNFHNAESPHECQTCGKKFGWKSQLTLHQKKHYCNKGKLPTDDKDGPATCKYCQLVVSNTPNLKRHIEVVSTWKSTRKSDSKIFQKFWVSPSLRS
jgi:KRAB domain-containing zinc finger protein